MVVRLISGKRRDTGQHVIPTELVLSESVVAGRRIINRPVGHSSISVGQARQVGAMNGTRSSLK